MKTAVTVLQEMMVKLGQTPEYECISQSGPQHQATFEYRCVACGVVVTAAARSKKEAKQEVARVALRQLALLGHGVPPPYGLALPPQLPPQAQSGLMAGVAGGGAGAGGEAGAGLGAGAGAGAGAGGSDARSYVALLKELCEEYKLPAVEYELVGDTGPPHLRQFTVRARIGAQHARLATAPTKKAARQRAADQLYSFLRENLARITHDFVEEDALVRARDKAMERFQELRDQPLWRPDLSQKVSEYHLGLAREVDESKRSLALEVVEALEQSPERCAHMAWGAAGLRVEWEALEAQGGGGVCALAVGGASPALAFAGSSRAAAAAASLRYLRAALRHW